MEEEQETTKYQDTHVTNKFEGWQDTYNTIQLRLDPTPTLIQIRHLLKNEWWNETINAWTDSKDQKPLMTEEGIERLMLQLQARMSTDKVLSNLEEKRILLFINQLGDVMLEFLWYNSDKYEIKESDYRNIVMLVLHNVEIFFRRAKLGQENILLNQSMVYREVVGHDQKQQPQEKKPFLGFWRR